MTTFDGAWSASEAAEFLDAAIVPIRVACHHPGGGLWMLSLWYRYRDGLLECATGADADIVGFLERNDDVCFEVSTNAAPYMGVRGAGTADVVPEAGTDCIRALVERYLGGTDSAMAEWLLDAEREEVAIRIDPERFHTWDFTPRMRSLPETAPVRTESVPESPTYD